MQLTFKVLLMKISSQLNGHVRNLVTTLGHEMQVSHVVLHPPLIILKMS